AVIAQVSQENCDADSNRPEPVIHNFAKWRRQRRSTSVFANRTAQHREDGKDWVLGDPGECVWRDQCRKQSAHHPPERQRKKKRRKMLRCRWGASEFSRTGESDDEKGQELPAEV